MDIGTLIVFAHAGVAGLPDHESIMYLLPTLPVLLIGTILVAGELRRRGVLGENGETIRLTAALDAIAASLSLGAAAVHFSVIAEHLEFDPLYGLFFIGLGWFQVIWPTLYLLRRSRLLATLAALVNVAVVGVWLISRTTGLPLGPTPWIPEPVGGLDIVATAFEICLIGVLLPTVVPGRMPSLVLRRMELERAFVLATFSAVTIALVASVVMLG